MFYIIESEYVGPDGDQDEYIDADTIEIHTVPARANSSGEVCVEGWCGTTNDWAVYAHGEYATIEDARAAIREIFGDVRQQSIRDYPFDPEYDTVVEAYKPGRYEPMSSDETVHWCYESVKRDVTADTPDARIDELVTEYEAEANRDGFTLQLDAMRRFMRERRQELRGELDESEED